MATSKFRVLPYKQGSASAKALASALGGKVLKLEGSKYVAKIGDTVINWGNTNSPGSFGATHNANTETLRGASNKKLFFEKMKEKVDYYLNDVTDLSGAIGEREQIYQFFTESIEPETKRLLSEDYHFCRNWRLMGGKIYAAPWVELGHIGTYTFEGRLGDHS